MHVLTKVMVYRNGKGTKQIFYLTTRFLNSYEASVIVREFSIQLQFD